MIYGEKSVASLLFLCVIAHLHCMKKESYFMSLEKVRVTQYKHLGNEFTYCEQKYGHNQHKLYKKRYEAYKNMTRLLPSESYTVWSDVSEIEHTLRKKISANCSLKECFAKYAQHTQNMLDQSPKLQDMQDMYKNVRCILLSMLVYRAKQTDLFDDCIHAAKSLWGYFLTQNTCDDFKNQEDNIQKLLTTCCTEIWSMQPRDAYAAY